MVASDPTRNYCGIGWHGRGIRVYSKVTFTKMKLARRKIKKPSIYLER